MHARHFIIPAAFAITVSLTAAPPQKSSAKPAAAPAATANPKLAQYKKDAGAEIDATREFTQQMNDQVFSFGELGFQEIEEGQDQVVADVLDVEAIDRLVELRRDELE